MSKYKYIFCVLLTLVLIIPSVSPVLAIEYGGVGGRPANPREDNPRSESIFIHEISPKETIEDGIKVINNSIETKTLLIYATDETPSTDGGYACKQLSESSNGVGNWINLKKKEITLKSISSEVVPFIITAPENTDVGEHNGCIVIQEKKAESDDAGLRLSFRTGIRVALTIPGKIIRLLEIVNFKVVDKDADTYTLTPTVKNGGNTSIDTDITVKVANVLTKEITAFGGNNSVLRNNPLVLNYDFPKPFWGGKYSAKTIVTYKDGKDEITIESQAIEFSSWPKKQALIYVGLGAFLIVIIFVVVIILKIKKARKLKSWQDYIVKEGDTLSNIIKNRNDSWKEVVTVNKLKPPYEFKIGQTIKIPPKK